VIPVERTKHCVVISRVYSRQGDIVLLSRRSSRSICIALIGSYDGAVFACLLISGADISRHVNAVSRINPFVR
jgi:hypothetical protein